MTAISSPPQHAPTGSGVDKLHVGIREALLACGVVYVVLYPIVNDVVAASLYDGYSRMSQAVSELSAVGAPSRTFLTVMAPVFVLLHIGFGLGIWRSGRGRRSVRVAGGLVVAHGVMSVLWLFAPMSDRDVLAAGGGTTADVMHLALAAATGVFVAASVTALAVAYGWVFRVYSMLTLAAAIVFGQLSAQVEEVEAGEPTPYMGLLERIGMGAWFVWLVVAAVVLMRPGPRTEAVTSVRTERGRDR